MKAPLPVFKVEMLDNKVLIDEACELLHLVYIDKDEWCFSAENPSHIRIEKRNGKNILVDRFVEGARWFGIFDGDELIACARLYGLDSSGRYEMEGYPNSEKVWPYLRRENCMEMGKVAVHPKYHGYRVVNLIYLSVFEYCQRNHYSVFGGVANVYVNSLFRRVTLNPTIKDAFKYEKTDFSPVNFYFVDYERGDYKTIIPALRATITQQDKSNSYSVMEALEIVAPLLPVPAYWINQDGVVLGINDLCLKAMGANYSDVIGKTPYDFYPDEVAEYILTHNNLVMRSGQIISQDEVIKNLTTGELVHAKAVKVPLYDDNGNIVGIIGTSVDMTAERRAEQLKLETELQQIALAEKEKFVLLARKVAHDITSPLTTIKILAPLLKEAPEKQQQTFILSIEKLLQISDHLLSTYRRAENEPIEEESKNQVHLYDEIEKIIEEKKIQYRDRYITLFMESCEKSRDVIVDIQLNQFRRALSNLINNAVDALRSIHKIYPSIVKVNLKTNCNFITIGIQDSGHGMPQEVRQKILSGCKVTHDKENGNGLGMQQVWDLLNQNDATLAIDSNPEYGTLIEITFPIYNKGIV